VNTSGTYWVKATDDCDRVSRDTVKVNISKSSSKNQTVRICQGKTYSIGSNRYTKAGVYTDTLSNSAGCDSIVKTTLIVDPTYTIQQSFTICQGDSIKIGTKFYKTAGTYRETLQTIRGCDSLIVAQLTVNVCGPSIGGIVNKYSAVTDISCDKVTVEQGTLFKAGDRVLIIQMQGAQIDTTNSIKFGSIIDYRNAGNYEFNTVKKVTSNKIDLTFSLKNKYDLDGKIQLVYVPTYTDIAISSKLTGQPWNGKTGGVIALEVAGKITLNANIEANGIGFRGGISVNGDIDPPYCLPDVIYNTLASKNGGHKGEGIATWNTNKILNKGSWSNGGGGGNIHNGGGGGGSLYSKGGQGGKIYEDPGIRPICLGGNGLGGIQLNWNINKIFMGGGGGAGHDNDKTSFPGGNGGGIILIKSQAIILNNYSIISNGVTPLPAGNDGASGGGSGGSIIIESQIQTNAGKLEAKGGNGANNNWINYRQCVAPGGGGSGGFIQVLNNLPSNNYSIEKGISGRISVNNSACSNSQFGAEDGQNGRLELKASLNYSSVLNSSLDTVKINAQTCEGIFYKLPNGDSTKTAGIYNILLKSSAGCDSIFNRITLVIKPISTKSLSYSICQGESVKVGNSTYKTTGTFKDTLTARNGCDSIITTTLKVNPVSAQNISKSICQGDSIKIGSQIFKNTGTFKVVLKSVFGCDSTINLTLSVSAVIRQNQTIKLCQGESVKIGKNTYNTAGTYLDTLSTVSGCDSVLTTKIEILPTQSKNVTFNICAGASVKIGENVYTTSGTYTNTLKNTNGCDSTIIATINVQQASSNTNEYKICKGDSVVINNKTYYQAGTFTDTLRSNIGCDSIYNIINILITPELQLNLGNDTILCQDEIIVIGTSTLAENYLWNTGSSESNIDAVAPGVYVLTISNNCYSVTDTLTLDAIDCDCKVFIPNAFSPNSDGKNDQLIIKEENIIESKLMIYNKWGEEVFQSLNNTTQWNGAYKDKQLAPDVYGYHYEGTCVKGNKIEYKGNITIVR
jgi:gliding motility-associated-like protein